MLNVIQHQLGVFVTDVTVVETPNDAVVDICSLNRRE